MAERIGLVLSRRKDQRILIGDDIVVTLVDVRGNKARIGVRAPKGVRVDREEIAEARAGEGAGK